LSNQQLVIRIEARVSALPELLDRLEVYCDEMELSPRVGHRLTIVCEELAANVAMHGAEGEGGATYVEIAVDCHGGTLYLSIQDDGRPFDPLSQAPPDTALNLEDRKIGGLGIHFVRNMVQDITYERTDTLNRLTARLSTTE
jgi:serine/threonine-protein kinase RsbW